MAGVAVLCAASWAVHASRRRPHKPPASAEGAWPSAAAPLTVLPARFQEGFGKRRVYVDAGHGAPQNPGNTSCFCVEEQAFTLIAARELATRLAATERFEARVSREEGALREYSDRVDEAERWGAHVFVSLHSDVRKKPVHGGGSGPAGGPSAPAPPDAGSPPCPTSYDAPGFSVLYSDEGAAPRVQLSLDVARAVAGRMSDAGFFAYDGADYGALYAATPSAPGVFVDRHDPGQRIYVLKRPKVPAILIETHHALDPREAARWSEPKTFDAFAAAVARALGEVL